MNPIPFPLDMAVVVAVQFANAYINGHSWPDELGEIEVRAVLSEWRIKIGLTPELLKALRWTAEWSRRYIKELDIYGYEARSIACYVNFINDYLDARKAEEEHRGE